MSYIKYCFKKCKTTFLDALYPEDIKCFGCGKDLPRKNIYNICPECMPIFEINDGKICNRCGANVYGDAGYCFECKNNERFFDKARAPLIYTGVTKRLIRKFKYDDATYLKRYFARLLAEEYARCDFIADVVVPVPMSKEHLKARGYNQALLIAEEFCKLMNLPLDKDNLVRIRNTESQTAKTREERKHNLDGAFEQIDKTAFVHKNVLLIDDVFTTGSTANECAKTLRASHVYVLTVAHTKTHLRGVSAPATLSHTFVGVRERTAAGTVPTHK